MSDHHTNARAAADPMPVRRLFAERFAVPQVDTECPEPILVYDERRQLNVGVDGLPSVAVGIRGRTDTLTEVRAEQDDFDRPGDGDSLGFDTSTRVRREADDFAGGLILATETRALPGERDDFDRASLAIETRPVNPGTSTSTKVRAEADDFAGEHADWPL